MLTLARYLPYGGWRVTPTADLTDRAYTGQKHNMDIGLYYYNARYYAPYINRFISADTLVPDPTNPQQFNRYTYVLNNPLVFVDPTGHYSCIPSVTGNTQHCVDAVFADPAYKSWHNGIDVTDWLLWKMETNAQGNEIAMIGEFMSVTTLPDALQMRTIGYWLFKELVDYGQLWDFKVIFNRNEVEWIIIGDYGFRMDIVANIHYGFVGNEAGFLSLELYAAAGIAQFVGGDRQSGKWYAFGDDPVDKRAIQLGVELNRRYSSAPTRQQFLRLLDRYVTRGYFDDILVNPPK